MAGTISTLGIGSGIELQDMLDQLRALDQQTVTRKEGKVTVLENQLAEFTTVNNKLLALKTAALNLSLASNFIGRTATTSDEDVATATASAGAVEQSVSLDVTRLAAKSSWMSAAGAASADTSVYVPVSQETTTGVTDPAVDAVARSGESMVITFGETDLITVDAAADMTMNDLVNAINTHVDNVGAGDNGRLVTAETYVVEGKTFLRIRSDVAAGTGEGNRVAVNENFVGFDFAAPAATFSYQVGDGDAVSVAVAADTTLTQLAALINDAADNPGVTATVINDGGASPYRLSLTSDTIGEDGRITFISELDDLDMAEQQGAGGASLNAQFSIDGINYQRQSNSFNDVVSGVTLTLEDVGTATITVGNNNASVKEMIQGLVTAYNAAVQEVRDKSGYDSEKQEFGLLAGTTLRDLPFTMRNLMSSTSRADESGKVTTFFALGLEFNRDGTITLDEELLDAAMADSPDSVSAFFLGDADNNITGFADKVNDALRSITGTEGQIDGEKKSAQVRIDALEAKIEAENERLDRKYVILAKQFTELDRYMNEMTNLSSYLSNQFDSLSSSWGTGSSRK